MRPLFRRLRAERGAIQVDAHFYVAGSAARFGLAAYPAWTSLHGRAVARGCVSVPMAHPVDVMRIEPAVRMAPVRVSEPLGEPGVPSGVAMFAIVGDSPYRNDHQDHHARS